MNAMWKPLGPVTADALLVDAQASIETALAHPDYTVQMVQILLERALHSVEMLRRAQPVAVQPETPHCPKGEACDDLCDERCAGGPR